VPTQCSFQRREETCQLVCKDWFSPVTPLYDIGGMLEFFLVMSLGPIFVRIRKYSCKTHQTTLLASAPWLKSMMPSHTTRYDGTPYCSVGFHKWSSTMVFFVHEAFQTAKNASDIRRNMLTVWNSNVQQRLVISNSQGRFCSILW
jgi:hypothetical protein